MNNDPGNDKRYIVYLIVFALIVASLIFYAHHEKEIQIQDFITAINKDDVANAKALLEKRPDLVNSKDKIMGFSPLCGSKSREMVNLLITYGADFNARTAYGATPLHIMGNRAQLDALELLITKGADVNAKDNDGSTPLFYVASSSGSVDTAEFLISEGTDVNAKDNDGNTPLFIAARTGQFEMVKFFISKGAQVNIRNNNGRTPLKCAMESKDTTDTKSLKDIADFLRKHGAKE